MAKRISHVETHTHINVEPREHETHGTERPKIEPQKVPPPVHELPKVMPPLVKEHPPVERRTFEKGVQQTREKHVEKQVHTRLGDKPKPQEQVTKFWREGLSHPVEKHNSEVLKKYLPVERARSIQQITELVSHFLETPKVGHENLMDGLKKLKEGAPEGERDFVQKYIEFQAQYNGQYTKHRNEYFEGRKKESGYQGLVKKFDKLTELHRKLLDGTPVEQLNKELGGEKKVKELLAGTSTVEKRATQYAEKLLSGRSVSDPEFQAKRLEYIRDHLDDLHDKIQTESHQFALGEVDSSKLPEHPVAKQIDEVYLEHVPKERRELLRKIGDIEDKAKSYEQVTSELRKLLGEGSLRQEDVELVSHLVRHYTMIQLHGSMVQAIIPALVQRSLFNQVSEFFAKKWVSQKEAMIEIRKLQEKLRKFPEEIEQRTGRTRLSTDEKAEVHTLESRLRDLMRTVEIDDDVSKQVHQIEQEHPRSQEGATNAIEELQKYRRQLVNDWSLKDGHPTLDYIDGRIEIWQTVKEIAQIEENDQRLGNESDTTDRLRELHDNAKTPEVAELLNRVIHEHEVQQNIILKVLEAGKDHIEQPSWWGPNFSRIAMKESLREREVQPSKEMLQWVESRLGSLPLRGTQEYIQEKRRQIEDKFKNDKKARVEALQRLDYEESAFEILGRGNRRFIDHFESWDKQIRSFREMHSNGKDLIARHDEVIKEFNNIIGTERPKLEKAKKDVVEGLQYVEEIRRSEVHQQLISKRLEVEREVQKILTGEKGQSLAPDVRESLEKLSSLGERLTNIGEPSTENVEQQVRLYAEYVAALRTLDETGLVDQDTLRTLNTGLSKEMGSLMALRDAHSEVDELSEKLIRAEEQVKFLQAEKEQIAGIVDEGQYKKWENFYERQKYGLMMDEATRQIYDVSKEIRNLEEERRQLLEGPRSVVSDERIQAINLLIGERPSNTDINKLIERQYELRSRQEEGTITQPEKAELEKLKDQIGSLNDKRAQLLGMFESGMGYMRLDDLNGVESYPSRSTFEQMTTSLKDVLGVDFSGDYARPLSDYYLEKVLQQDGYSSFESLSLLWEKIKDQPDAKTAMLAAIKAATIDLARVGYQNPQVAQSVLGDLGHAFAQLTGGEGISGIFGNMMGRLTVERRARDLLVGDLLEGEGAPHFDQGLPPETIGIIRSLQKAPYVIGAMKGATGSGLIAKGMHLLTGETPIVSHLLGAGGGLLQTALEKRVAQSMPRDSEKYILSALHLYENKDLKGAAKDFIKRNLLRDIGTHVREIYEYGFVEKLKNLVTLKTFRRWLKSASPGEIAYRIFGQTVVPVGMVGAAIAVAIATGGVALIPILIAAAGSSGIALMTHFGFKYLGNGIWRDTDDKMFRMRNRERLEQDFEKFQETNKRLNVYSQNLKIAEPEILRTEILDSLSMEMSVARKEARERGLSGDERTKYIEGRLERIVEDDIQSRRQKKSESLKEELSNLESQESNSLFGSSSVPTVKPNESEIIKGLEEALFEPYDVNEDVRAQGEQVPPKVILPEWNSFMQGHVDQE